MRRKRTYLFSFVLFCVSASLYGQSWSGIIDRSRAIDWTRAGVTGGIPSANWRQCGSTVPAGTSAATINSDLAACPSNTYVLLAPGTFNLATGIIMQRNVVLRGAGADQTFLVFSGSANCGGWGGSDICFYNPNFLYYGSAAVAPGGSNAATWTRGF